MNPIEVLMIVTNVGQYGSTDLHTGLWLSELTHIYHAAEENGYGITIASPEGGNVPIDPESLRVFALDKVSKAYWSDPVFRRLLSSSAALDAVSGRQFDMVYLATWHYV